MLTSTRYAKSNDVITQRVKDETVLFDMIRGDYFSLNDLGAQTWALLDGSRSMSEIATHLSAEYDAPADVIELDIQSLTEQLLRAGLLVDPKGDN